MSQQLQPKLSEAVQAEIQFIRNEFEEQTKLSPTELRKQGLSIFPLKCIGTEGQTNGTALVLQTSFYINDTHFRNGSSVTVYIGNETLNGRVLFLNAKDLGVFIKDEFESNPLEEEIRIDFQPDDRTLKCMELGVELLEKRENLQEFQIDFYSETESYSFSDLHLNTSQQEAVGAILSEKPTVCIQGPPGTGKTTTLARAISELVKQGKQVIVSAPSNTAVDNLVLKLITAKIPVLRLGNDEKIHTDVLPFTIDAYLERSAGKTIDHLKKELKRNAQILNKFVRNYNAEAAAEKRTARNELKAIKRDLRALETAERDKLVETISVLAGTPVALFNNLKKEHYSDVVILDEAGQCLSPLAWLAASFGKRFVLCGDPQQLPPLIQSPKAQSLGLGESLLEAACNVSEPSLLKTQYRMSEEIVAAINPFFYKNQLETVEGISSGKCYFVDMAGYSEGEQKDEISESTFNLSELEILQKCLDHFQMNPKETVVLSPYSAQLEKAQHLLGSAWKCSTIDSMQGQESEQIIISLTRSNENQELGFLKDYRRTNVAISRAKTLCVVIGDSTTIGQDAFYSTFISYAENAGTYISCWELI